MYSSMVIASFSGNLPHVRNVEMDNEAKKHDSCVQVEPILLTVVRYCATLTQ